MQSTTLQLENRTQVILWLRDNYKHATTTSVSKRSVFGHYLEACRKQGVLTPISHTYFGKLVRKAFPDVRCNRKGPRGSAQQHYRLIRSDGGDSDEFLSAYPGDEEDDEEEYASRSATKRNIAKAKSKIASTTAARKKAPSRARAAATAAASTISRMISADQAPTHLTEAWSFSSAPSSPTLSTPSSPAQSSSEEDDEAGDEIVQEDYIEEIIEEDEPADGGANAETEDAIELNFELPQFEILPGEESPGASFSYEACPGQMSGQEQNLILQQQLQCGQQSTAGYFEPSVYNFVSADLELPLSAINQVNLAEDFGWNAALSSTAVDGSASAYYHHYPQPQKHFYQQQQQPQSTTPLLSFLLADQLPAAQCSDLAEWVEHYCN